MAKPHKVRVVTNSKRTFSAEEVARANDAVRQLARCLARQAAEEEFNAVQRDRSDVE